MQKTSFRQKARYGFDNLMSKGTPVLIGSLAIVSIGYKIFNQETDSQKSYGIYINPVKSDLIALSDEDSIIVISEN